LDNLPRLLFYLSGVLILSGAFTILTTDLLPKMTILNFTGSIFLLGFSLVYMNMTLVTSRRYLRKLETSSKLPYVFALLIAMVPVMWSFILSNGLYGMVKIIYILSVSLACLLGAYFGQKAGEKAQITYKKQLHE
jgi:CDP-diglyceride synthetase